MRQISDIVAIHRLGERIQFVFTHAYDRNVGMDANAVPTRLGTQDIVSSVHDIILDLDRAIALRSEIAAGGGFVDFSYWDYRGGSCIRVRQTGDPFDGPRNVGLTMLRGGCALAHIELDALQRESFLFALDNALLGSEASCSL